MRSSNLRQLSIQGVTLTVVLLCVVFGGFNQAWAAPKADLWARWQAHNAQSSRMIDHRDWDQLIKRSIKPGPGGVNLFGYASVSAADKQQLNHYIISLTKTSISQYNRREQLAYWINLYNALTVQVVLDHYPVASIRDIDITPGFFADGPWGKKLVTVEDENISLDDIEHRILRPIWQDNRIHYAVNCASIGCPNLQGQVFTSANVEKLLTLGAKQYINSVRGVAVKGEEVTVSKIYNWFQSDFGSSESGVLMHLLKYANPKLKEQLQAIGEISDFAYDWRLNDAN